MAKPAVDNVERHESVDLATAVRHAAYGLLFLILWQAAGCGNANLLAPAPPQAGNRAPQASGSIPALSRE